MQPSQIQSIKATFSSAGQSASGSLDLQFLNAKDLLLKRIYRTALLFVLAFVSLFIPILHFFFTPLLLIATLISAFSPGAANVIVLKGEGICPGCGSAFRVMKHRYKSSFEDVCEKCSRRITITSVVP